MSDVHYPTHESIFVTTRSGIWTQLKVKGSHHEYLSVASCTWVFLWQPHVHVNSTTAQYISQTHPCNSVYTSIKQLAVKLIVGLGFLLFWFHFHNNYPVGASYCAHTSQNCSALQWLERDHVHIPNAHITDTRAIIKLSLLGKGIPRNTGDQVASTDSWW